jgi:anti-sigma B factor antagonist
MELTRTVADGELSLLVEGRVDSYWSDHLDAAIADAVREGHHRIAVDCAKVTFLSSAGIGILMKHHQELVRINGVFRVVSPSKPVATVLHLTRLAEILIGAPAPVLPTTTAAPTMARHLEADGLALDVYELDRTASVVCRPVGSPEPLASGGFDACVSLEGTTPAFAIGIGAFGDSFEDCRSRFGELISVSSATASQPADGTNVPDYLLTRGALGADVQLLYGLIADGRFSHLVRFEAAAHGGFVTLSKLLTQCLDIAGAKSIGLVMVAETEGLVGTALRSSPAQTLAGGDFFAHPSIRTRLSFSAERTFTHSVSLTAGFAARETTAATAAQFRPVGGGTVGHLHAAAFRFQPIQKGLIDLPATVARLFEPNQLTGVLHLLHDDRGASSAGDSEFIRGACWIAPSA